MNANNIEAVLSGLIRGLKIPVTNSSIKAELDKHPDRATMYVIFDMLKFWRVPSGAYELTFDELINANVPLPFVADFTDELVLVNRMDSDKVVISNEHWNNHTLNILDFKRKFSGNIICAEKDEDSGELDYSIKRRKDILSKIRVPFTISAVFVLLLIYLLFQTSFFTNLGWQVASLTLFKTLGLAVSVLLLMQTIDVNNPLIHKFCGGDNGKNCNAILSSKAAKITDEVSWSEIGFFYFAGTWLTLLFNSNNPNVMYFLSLLCVLCLPYSIYSIYYQWRIAKQWCIFCCAVQAIFWLEFFTVLPFLLQPVLFLNLADLVGILIPMSLPVLGWVLIKPTLLLTNQIKPLRDQVLKFKYNSELFNKLLESEPQYALPEDDHSIILGNAIAENVITLVSNPYCGPCATAHKKLDEWITDRDDIKLQLIFTANGEVNDRETIVAAHLLGVQASQEKGLMKESLNDWYGQEHKNFDVWSKKYPIVAGDHDAQKLVTHRDWCKETKITATPTIFINGRRLPENYQPEDLRYFL